MFGGLTNLINSAPVGSPPKDVPEATHVNLPDYTPPLRPARQAPEDAPPVHNGNESPTLIPLLQSIYRPADLDDRHFAALGVNVHNGAVAEHLVPDGLYLPSSSGWDDITIDEAQERDSTFKHPLSNGNASPDARTYLERRNELSVNNQAAFRTVRRMRPEPGRQPARLGHCYEFFRQLELMATFWDDTSLPAAANEGDEENESTEDKTLPVKTPRTQAHPIDGSLEQVGHAMIATAAGSHPAPASAPAPSHKPPERVTWRTSAGTQMPTEFRQSLVTAFLKLVTYDFGCNVCPPRVEPRVHLLGPPGPRRKASHFPSSCSFLNRRPTTREAARAGIFEGPAAVVSIRNTVAFNVPQDARIDFGRELISALATAQLRRRQGKTENVPGKGKWWTTTRRWGGGEGGPIGRDTEGDPAMGDKEPVAVPEAQSSIQANPSLMLSGRASGSDRHLPAPRGIIPSRSHPSNRKPRKNQANYDNYRLVRPPASNWDRKTHYEAIGRARGTSHDDIFVFSSLFHHLSIVRVRVPDQLLDLLEGGGQQSTRASPSAGVGREDYESPTVEVWRSQWFDLFKAEDRLEAMRTLWGVVGWLMRAQEE